MFKIINENFGSFDSVKILNSQHGIELQIINGFGAIINKYIVNNSPFSFISGYQDHREIVKQHPFFSRSAKLFPFPNRLNLGRYTFDNRNYQLPANFPWSDHAVHGLLYNQPFKLTEFFADEESASASFQFKTDSLHQGFPFAFEINITFSINADGVLHSSTDIKNCGDVSFPFGDAWHPYFSLNTDRENCTLTLPSCVEVIHSNDLPTGDTQPCHDFSQSKSLQGLELNHCFQFPEGSQTEITLQRDDLIASLYYQQDENYPYVQLYTPDQEQSIAIEPMSCPADAFNNHMGLLTLAPNQNQTFTWQCQAVYRPN